MSEQTTPGRERLREVRDMLRSEREAAALYRSLAGSESGERREVFLELADIEDRHAEHWEDTLRTWGASVPAPRGPGLRTRALGLAARRLSTDRVLPLIERAERADAGKYDADPDAPTAMAADERSHARRLAHLAEGRPTPKEAIERRETWHRSDRSGALRAGVFGVSDGLVSNTSLVMGFAGSGSSRSAILLAGVAGLLAGSFSMAAGEYVSVASQREMYEREIALEARELEEKPEEERDELVLLYRAKGLSRDEARSVADTIMQDKQTALDTLAREELGLDPTALGSPWAAAGSSLVTFALGALVVVLPYLFGGGTAALLAAVGLSVLAMLGVGAILARANRRPVLRSALRQLLVGGLAALITFGVGRLIGVSVG